MDVAEGDRIMTLAEVAAYARMGKSTIRQAIYAGRGPMGFKAPGSDRWRFRRAAVDAWLDAGQSKRAPRAAE